jgi:hypothetical protein
MEDNLSLLNGDITSAEVLKEIKNHRYFIIILLRMKILSIVE